MAVTRTELFKVAMRSADGLPASTDWAPTGSTGITLAVGDLLEIQVGCNNGTPAAPTWNGITLSANANPAGSSGNAVMRVYRLLCTSAATGDIVLKKTTNWSNASAAGAVAAKFSLSGGDSFAAEALTLEDSDVYSSAGAGTTSIDTPDVTPAAACLLSAGFIALGNAGDTDGTFGAGNDVSQNGSRAESTGGGATGNICIQTAWDEKAVGGSYDLVWTGQTSRVSYGHIAAYKITTSSGVNRAPGAGSAAVDGGVTSLNTGVRPAIGAVVIAGLAATLSIAQTVQPPGVALAMEGNAPTAIVSGVARAVPAGAATIEGIAARVGLTVRPAGAVASLDGQAPTASVTSSGVSPGSASATVAGGQLALATDVRPAAGGVSISGLSPLASVNVTRELPSAAIAAAGQPTTLSHALRPAAAAAGIVGQTPRLDSAVRPSAAAATIGGFGPTLSTASTLSPAAGVLSAAGALPRIAVDVRPSSGAAALATSTAALTFRFGLQPVTAGLSLTGVAPAASISESSPVRTPATAALTLGGLAPAANVPFAFTRARAWRGADVLDAWIQLRHVDASGTPTTFSMSAEVFNRPWGSYHAFPSEGRLMRIGPIGRGASDVMGQPRASTCEVVVSDFDRKLRGWLGSVRQADLTGAEMTIHVIARRERWNGVEPLMAYRGFVADYTPGENRTFEFRLEDFVSLMFGEDVPFVTIGTKDFPNCPAANIGAVLSPIYGDLNSTTGAARTLYVGAWPYPILGQTWRAFAIAHGACKSLDDLFVDGVVVNSGEYGVTWLAPGKPGWSTVFGSVNYTDLNGTRYTLVFGRGPIADALADGEAVLSANVKGVETVGDSTGSLTNSIYSQAIHVLENFVLAKTPYRGGNWPALGTLQFSDGTAMVNAASFVDVSLNYAARLITAGNTGAWQVTQPLTRQNLVALLNLSMGTDSHVDARGRWTVSMFDPDGASERPLEEQYDIHELSLRVQDRKDLIENVIEYVHTPNYVTGEFAHVSSPTELAEPSEYGGAGVEEHGQSVATYGRRTVQGGPLVFAMRRNATAARQLALRRLAKLCRPWREISLRAPLHAFHSTVGANQALTHGDGTTSQGWTNRAATLRESTIDLAAAEVQLVLVEHVKALTPDGGGMALTGAAPTATISP
jgi:hypothetical protein